MNGIHPKLSQAMALAALTLCISVVGCSNQPGALKNPFSTVDRVPPPSTRVVPPGAAAPYYQGDPLPIMQSSTTAPGAGGAVAATPTVTNAAATVAASPAVEPKKLAFSNEPIVAIPGDSDALRFELPPPAKTEVAAASSLPQAPGSIPSPAAFAQGAPQSPVSSTVTGPGGSGSSPVVNAAYEAPMEPSSNGPWRSPQIATANVPQPTHMPQAMAQPVVASPIAGYAPTAAGVPSTMDVRMRAVPSTGPVESSGPRIRLPGYPAPQGTNGVNGGVPPTAYYAPAAGGAVQTLQVATGPPQGYYDPVRGAFVYTQPTIGTVAATTPAITSAGGDGFRPRSSMR